VQQNDVLAAVIEGSAQLRLTDHPFEW
jgi:hypothetical protein